MKPVPDTRVVAILGEQYRVVASSCGIQWIIEKRAGQRNGQARWDAVKYHRNRESLIASCRALGIEIEASQFAALEALPPFFGGAS